MKTRVRFFTVLISIGCLIMGNLSAFAAEKNFIETPSNKIEVFSEETTNIETLSSPSLAACTLEIGIGSNGVAVSFVTSATQAANEIGVKDIVLQEKTWYGWKDIPISNLYTNNSDMYVGGVTYTNAEAGKTYRVHCTHYAKYGNTELTLYNESNNLVYN